MTSTIEPSRAIPTVSRFDPGAGAVRVFVGATGDQMLAVRVLAYSIRRHSSLPVQVVPLHRAMAEAGLAAPVPVDPVLRARTPFSFQRFAIPELCGFAGRAIYLDSDMLVFRDIAELWQVPMPVPVRAVRPRPWRLRRPQLSVMLLDCARLDWRVSELTRRLDLGELSYRVIMDGAFLGSGLARDLPPGWNDLERFRAGETALLHYTDMSRQPWLDGSNRLAPIWCRALIDAVDDDVIGVHKVASEVEAGAVRPSLLRQVRERQADPRALPRAARLQDLAGFIPPHRRARNASGAHSPVHPSVLQSLRAQVTLTANDLGLARGRVELGHLLRRVTNAAASVGGVGIRGSSG